MCVLEPKEGNPCGFTIMQWHRKNKQNKKTRTTSNQEKNAFVLIFQDDDRHKHTKETPLLPPLSPPISPSTFFSLRRLPSPYHPPLFPLPLSPFSSSSIPPPSLTSGPHPLKIALLCRCRRLAAHQQPHPGPAVEACVFQSRHGAPSGGAHAGVREMAGGRGPGTGGRGEAFRSWLP